MIQRLRCTTLGPWEELTLPAIAGRAPAVLRAGGPGPCVVPHGSQAPPWQEVEGTNLWGGGCRGQEGS